MPLARDLNDLIHRYGGAIAAGGEAVLLPRYSPGAQLPDLSAIEQCRSKATGKQFTFYPSQCEKIAGALAGLKAKGRVWMVCEMGCGKSPMSLAAAWSLLHHPPFRILVMCPGHIVRKWRREVGWAIPGVICKVIRRYADVAAFEAETRSSPSPMVAVIGKDTAKLGFDVDRPCAAKRKMKLRFRLDSAADMQPGDMDLREIPADTGPSSKSRASSMWRHVHVAEPSFKRTKTVPSRSLTPTTSPGTSRSRASTVAANC